MSQINQTTDTDYLERYRAWRNACIHPPLKMQLEMLSDEEKKDRFYKHLSFGTGGLRGEIDVGTNRMNIYTVRRATQGLARYLSRKGEAFKKRGVAIAWDSRHFSDAFAEQGALVLCHNGIRAFLFSEMCPTPVLSFAVRELKAAAGIVITASHNPPEYNGYKVYGEDGGQIPPGTAEAISKEMETIENGFEVGVMSREEAVTRGLLVRIGPEIEEQYQSRLKSLMLQPEIVRQTGGDIKIVYTPLHGTGNNPVREALERAGFKQVMVVPEQEFPDPYFSTVVTPNPEDRDAMKKAVELAGEEQADLVMATDPDADRVGVAVRKITGEYAFLNGNQIGVLLLDYILSRRQVRGMLPRNGAVIKTIVTSDMGQAIADAYGVRTVNTLTGFKYIGEKIGEFEKDGSHTFLFGYEESCGYLAGDFVRDKDAVQSCLLIAEMAAWHKLQGSSLYEALQQLYKKHGFYREELVSITLKGEKGQRIIRGIMESFRHTPITRLGNRKVASISDYREGITRHLAEETVSSTGLPLSDVIQFHLEGGGWVVLRPSGTEPKLKVYYSVKGQSEEACEQTLSELKKDVVAMMYKAEESS